MLDHNLDRLTITQPCNEGWESMTGNDQVRFCQHCNLHVSDLSQMTRTEALRLVTESRGRLCVRYVRLPNGRIATSDLPAKLYLIGRRASRIAAGAFTAAISLSSAPAQSRQPFASPETTTVELIQTLRQRQLLIDDFAGALSGRIKTPEGAPVFDATVILVDRESGVELSTLSSSLGRYEFQVLPPGDYLVWARKRGFITASAQIQINANTRLRQDLEIKERSLTPVTVMGGAMFGGWAEPEDALVKAISENDVERVRSLAFTDRNLNAIAGARYMTVLASAVQHGNREIVGILIAAGADVNVRNSSGQTGLMFLTNPATVDLVRDLLGAGAKVNARDNFGDNALMNAAATGNAAVLRELITAGARVDATNQSGETALFFAARGNNPEVVTLLLDAGAWINARNEDDATALLTVADDADFETFRVLVERGTNIRHPEIYGKTALMNAALNEDPRLVKLLLEAGADVNAKDVTHYTALMNAAERGRGAIIEILALAGADLNAKDAEGQTALLKAANQGHFESVQALLKAGVDITIKDKEGKTALALAREGEHEDVVALLRLHGARE
jgi:ankyrin repeat protein